MLYVVYSNILCNYILLYTDTHTYICTLILAALYINIIYYFTLFSEKYLKIYLLSVSYIVFILFIIIYYYFYILFIYYYYILFKNLFTICFIHRIYIIYLHFRDKFRLLEMKFTVVI